MCTSTKPAWLPKEPDQDGKRTLSFRPPNHTKLLQFDCMSVPCGKCISCKQLKAVKQAAQMAAELLTTKGPSWFLTLTVDDEHLRSDGSVDKTDIQKFNKRLRKYRIKHKHPGKYRNVYTGEYGGQFQRCHYHLAAFNLEFDDMQLWQEKHDYSVYISEILEKIWGKGSVHILELSYENCLYLAQHHLDEKVTLIKPVNELPYHHPVTNKLIRYRNPEFKHCSSVPGIGANFVEDYFSDIFPRDHMIINGQQTALPDYFMRLLKRKNPDLHDELKKLRMEKIQPRTLKERAYRQQYDLALLKTKQSNK